MEHPSSCCLTSAIYFSLSAVRSVDTGSRKISCCRTEKNIKLPVNSCFLNLSVLYLLFEFIAFYSSSFRFRFTYQSDMMKNNIFKNCKYQNSFLRFLFKKNQDNIKDNLSTLIRNIKVNKTHQDAESST